MKWLYNLILVCLLIVTLSACRKQEGMDHTADKMSKSYVQAGNVAITDPAEQEQSVTSETSQTEVQIETNLTEGQEQRTQRGDNTVMGDISFNFETKSVLLNSGYEMPIYGIGTWEAQTWRDFRKDFSVEELEVRFQFEEERLREGKRIRGKEFFRELRERIGSMGEPCFSAGHQPDVRLEGNCGDMIGGAGWDG